MSLFSILVDIAASTARLESGLDKAERRLEEFGEQARDVGEKIKGALEFAGVAVGIGEMVHKFDEYIESAENAEHASQKIGITAAEFSKLDFAAKNAGVGTEQLASGLEKFAKNAEMAAGGSKQQADAFNAIGVAVQDSSGHLKPMEELLDEVADKFAGYKDSAEKTALAQVLFGKAGADLIPLLNEGSKGISEYAQRAQDLGIVLDERTAKAAEAFHQKLIELHAVGDEFWELVASQLLPTLSTVADSFVKGGQSANKFTQEIEPIITGLKLIVDVGYSVERTFLDIGDAIGALASVTSAQFHGKLAEADQIWEDYKERAKQSESEANEFLKKLWSDTGNVIVGVADAADKAGNNAAKATAPIITQLGHAFDMADELLKTFAEIDKMSRHGTGNAGQVDLGNHAAEEAGRAIEKNHDQWIKAQQVARDSISQIQAFADQAAHKIQDSFANFLFDPFKGGMKGMLSSFITTIRKMIAEALSAKIMKTLFGGGGDGKDGGSGLGGLLGSGLSSLFGVGGGPDVGAASSAAGSAAADILSGALAGGGPASAGQTYLVGESGPELLTMGSSSGVVTPNHALGGSTVLNHSPTYNIDARGADAERIMSVMPSLLAQTKQATTRDILAAFRSNGIPAPRYA